MDDPDATRFAVHEWLGYARQVGGSALGRVLSASVDIALDRQDHTEARRQLTELERLTDSGELSASAFGQTVERLRQRAVEEAPPVVLRAPPHRGWRVLALYRLLLAAAMLWVGWLTVGLGWPVWVISFPCFFGYLSAGVHALDRARSAEVGFNWDGLTVRQEKHPLEEYPWTTVQRLDIVQGSLRATVKLRYQQAEDDQSVERVLPVPHHHPAHRQPDFVERAVQLARYAEEHHPHVQVAWHRRSPAAELLLLLGF
jgi:hypothetical protein